MKNKIKITNICVKFNFDCVLDLDLIEKKFEKNDLFNIKYNKNKFSGLVFKFKKYKMCFLIFKNGKINCVGSNDCNEIILAKNELFEILHEFNPKNSKVDLYNICASYNTNCGIDFLKIINKHKLQCSLEYELFAGLIFTLESKKFTIHRNGIIFSSGFKTVKEIKPAFEKMINLIKESDALVNQF